MATALERLTTAELEDFELAQGVLTETLHGPLPVRTVMRLAFAVTQLSETIRILRSSN